jgi:hypothetical protein
VSKQRRRKIAQSSSMSASLGCSVEEEIFDVEEEILDT